MLSPVLTTNISNQQATSITQISTENVDIYIFLCVLGRYSVKLVSFWLRLERST